MKNRKLRKFLMLVSSALLLVCVTVGATVAYLTAKTEEVVNTFTVGSVGFDETAAAGLDEADVDEYGELEYTVDADDNKVLKPRVTRNKYKLIPGHTYTKDPTVHVAADSEDAWVFVKVENGIADIEADTMIATQMAAKNWFLIDATNNIWAYEFVVTKNATKKDIEVFDTFTLKGDADVANYENAEIKITAYLVQAEGFSDETKTSTENATLAWTTTFGAAE